MNRRNFLTNSAKAGSLLLTNNMHPFVPVLGNQNPFKKSDFGKNFKWGVATASYQIEGAWNLDEKGPSIWDTFTHNTKKIKDKSTGDVACDFYHKYASDIALVKAMNFDVFRFSFSWSRIFPEGIGAVNQKGLDFYHRVIDRCLELDLEPWPTIYHWDLPQKLEDKGGWVNRDIISWFEEFTNKLTREFGDKVKSWMVLNEAASFTAAGYLGGLHAPGKISFKKFYDAVHHSNMCQGASGRIIRSEVANANVGTTISCSWVDPKNDKQKNIQAAKRIDALLNRLYLDPIVGRGYPTDAGKFFKKIAERVPSEDFQKLKFDFDFMGVQNYTRAVARSFFLIPVLKAFHIPPKKRGVPEDQITEMNWEVSPDGFYKILKQVGAYPEIKRIIVTENGVAFKDTIVDGKVNDKSRIEFFKNYLLALLKAKNEGVNIEGYFIWTLMDNFEWAEGYRPRFGVVYVDYKTQKRIIKDSGLWFKELLGE